MVPRKRRLELACEPMKKDKLQRFLETAHLLRPSTDGCHHFALFRSDYLSTSRSPKRSATACLDQRRISSKGPWNT